MAGPGATLETIMLNLVRSALLSLLSLVAVTAPAVRAQALVPDSPACRGATCHASVDVFPPAPELQVHASYMTDGRAATPYVCTPCIDCRASVAVRLEPTATGVIATVWEWGRVPTPEDEEAAGGIPSTVLASPKSALRTTLTGPCNGLVPVGRGSSVLTVALDTPTGRYVVTIWLACFC